ncbi:uncharacterized protein LACBIDRAFT_296797 [Laccaria bicolor S238N-H82]|uniref:Predicted protein n=1 Tax=Laccaria bicolor (strain S238N-H82 / ATCC MYA-4686) TaxID=486041 RepID=B0E345_LACBS|nr:uncharacterized protein LACBIDRAFT_296797 [Laccaria bicolor S238N-H82]EDQ98733.1 predicted protein [Laccaria bicolor S238N-H82]|eukprot:XP_001890610.1 predicted protein [Laccaria bicolor S238N-H82]
MLRRLRDLEEAESDSEDPEESESHLAEERESIVRADAPGPSTSTSNPTTHHTQSTNPIPTPTITRTTHSAARATIPHSPDHTSSPPTSTPTQSTATPPTQSTTTPPTQSTTTPPTQSTKPTHLEILQDTVAALKKTNLVTAIPNTTAAALTIQPTTSNELLLLAALCEAESRNAHAEIHAFELQASNILNEAYTERLRKALEAREEKRGKKKGIKLVGNGLPKLLSGNNFYELMQAKEKEVREVLKQKEAWKEGRVAYDAAVEVWAAADQERRMNGMLSRPTTRKPQRLGTIGRLQQSRRRRNLPNQSQNRRPFQKRFLGPS